MPRVASVRIMFTDGTSLDAAENDTVEIVSAGPGDAPQEGWQKLPGEGPARYGKVNKARAASVKQGQHMVTFRGVMKIQGARRM